MDFGVLLLYMWVARKTKSELSASPKAQQLCKGRLRLPTIGQNCILPHFRLLRVLKASSSPAHIQELRGPALQKHWKHKQAHLCPSLISTTGWEGKCTRAYWPCLLLWGVRRLRLCSSSWWVRVGLAPAIRRTVASCRNTWERGRQQVSSTFWTSFPHYLRLLWIWVHAFHV